MSAGRVRFLGTGNAFQVDGRGSPGVLVEPAGGVPFLVDCGPTSLAALHGARVDPGRIGALFLTHLHGDHTAGWPFLLLDLVYRARRADPFDVIGPAGTREVLEGLVRHTYPGTLDEPGFAVRIVEVPVTDAAGRRFGPIEAEILTVRHHASSIAWRFGLGSVLAVSGDTGWCPNLERLAHDADLLVLECTSLDPQTPTHLSLAEIRAHAASLRARRVLLVHLPDAVAEALALDPIPRFEAAHDGLVVDL
jgi:ribonuclease BN (tRNA processing enzyme)